MIARTNLVPLVLAVSLVLGFVAPVFAEEATGDSMSLDSYSKVLLTEVRWGHHFSNGGTHVLGRAVPDTKVTSVAKTGQISVQRYGFVRNTALLATWPADDLRSIAFSTQGQLYMFGTWNKTVCPAGVYTSVVFLDAAQRVIIMNPLASGTAVEVRGAISYTIPAQYGRMWEVAPQGSVTLWLNNRLCGLLSWNRPAW